MPKITLERAYIVADPIGDQVYLTLQRRLWWNLDLIEALYGPRDTRWTIMGVEYYPVTGQLSYHGQRIMVRLPLETMDDPIETYHFLAHETVHLLAPNKETEATVLEEGLCEMFAVDHTIKYFGKKIGCQNAKYAHAESLVRKLVAMDDPGVIRKLRAMEPAFRKMRLEHLRSVVPAVDDQFAAELLAPLWKEGEFEKLLAGIASGTMVEPK
jgi:hypothetical protein